MVTQKTLDIKRVIEKTTHSPEETQALGAQLARELKPPCVLLLEGELGSGKTTLVKGIVVALGAARQEEVTSPSFTLVHEYGESPKVYHADLYRVDTVQELGTLGLDDLFREDSIVIVEWGEKLGTDLPRQRWHVRLEHRGENDRHILAELVEG